MPDDLNSVKTAYHHGDLRAALLTAAEALIAERGPDGFSLREAARRAGVSAAAPAHHFGDARGLLTALATRAFAGLADALEGAGAGTTGQVRLRAQGEAYVAFALANPALFDLMWRKGRLDSENAALAAEAVRARRALEMAVAEARGGVAEEADVIAAWSIAHGVARLILDGPLDPATVAIVPAVLARLDI